MEKITIVYIGAREFDGKRYYGYLNIEDNSGSALYFKNRLVGNVYSIGALLETEKEGTKYGNTKVVGFLNKDHHLYSQLSYFSMEEKAANMKLENIKLLNRKTKINDFEVQVKAICDDLKYLDRSKRRLVVQHIVTRLFETL